MSCPSPSLLQTLNSFLLHCFHCPSSPATWQHLNSDRTKVSDLSVHPGCWALLENIRQPHRLVPLEIHDYQTWLGPRCCQQSISIFLCALRVSILVISQICLLSSNFRSHSIPPFHSILLRWSPLKGKHSDPHHQAYMYICIHTHKEHASPRSLREAFTCALNSVPAQNPLPCIAPLSAPSFASEALAYLQTWVDAHRWFLF